MLTNLMLMQWLQTFEWLSVAFAKECARDRGCCCMLADTLHLRFVLSLRLELQAKLLGLSWISKCCIAQQMCTTRVVLCTHTRAEHASNADIALSSGFTKRPST